MATAILLALSVFPVFAEDPWPGAEHVYVVNDYRYEPGDSGGDPDAGHSLCATRCNAISFDFRNIIDPGGWRLVLIATNREVILPLDNPFIGGHCVCLADEQVVLLNEFNRPKNPQDK